jgi:hypothetical protein
MRQWRDRMKPIFSGALLATILILGGCGSSSDETTSLPNTECIYSPIDTISISYGTEYSTKGTALLNGKSVQVQTDFGSLDTKTPGSYEVKYTSESCYNDASRVVQVLPQESGITPENILPF